MRTSVVGVVVAAGALAAIAALRWTNGDAPEPRTLVPGAAFPAAMAALPGGGLLYGERLTGRVVRVARDGATEVIGQVRVSTEGEQRGLLGLAVRDDQVFVSFTEPSGRLQVERLDGGVVWEGPPSETRANGGRIAFASDGTLVIGVGDLLDAEAAVDPTAPNGKMLALDPDGAPDQQPVIVSSGWNNPFAFAFAPDGTLYVADNVGGAGDERLAIGNQGSRPVVLATFPPDSVPSGIAVTEDGALAVCTYLERALRIYRIVDGIAQPDAEPLATDCSIGVVALADGTLAYADERTIRVLP